MNASNPTMMPVSDLSLDRRNPRLVEFDLPANATESEVIQLLWEAMGVRELALSIAASGYFQNEPLIVASENGRNVVIEGNRRLAAVKILLDDNLAETLAADVPKISPPDQAALNELPCVPGDRESSWRYLAFKHINGPAKWSSYAKSQYIADVHRHFGVPLPDIARQIGDAHGTVPRLFRGLMIIEQAERLKEFSRADRWHGHFSLSHLYTALGYPGIGSFIGLRPVDDENLEPVPAENHSELGELCTWLYGSKKRNAPPLIRSQNPDLQRLEAVVSDTPALAALRGGASLESAYELSRPSPNVFVEALVAARRNLQKAHGVLSVGYDGSEELLRIAGTVADLADDLYAEMERQRQPARRQRRISEAG